ncbi:hypothetical protein [Zunongwangia endophytica]|uniref:Outer membrane protein assembly factor BamA n=1 Tax=Zunongwangia endophytica TaxID=1808945 RepID=A0ABV8HDN5_9FLAO|nr:hypothetical protein [Zunongwangia endophytica]MDN3593348.1 hypothetical protein [Zunongwangia endophytica]
MRYAFILILFCCFSVSAQNDSLSRFPVRDSTQLAKDLSFYKRLQERTKNSKFTRMLYDLMFDPVDPANSKKATKKIEDQLQRDFKQYQGKSIRDIKINSLDPFGYSEKDTAVRPTKGIQKIGNVLHARTKSFTVRGLLLIEKNTKLDSLQILESERVLRAQKYIRRALIRPVILEDDPDSVDLYVYVLDSWSLSVDGDVSSRKVELRIREYNSFGLGHQTTLAYKQGYDDEIGFGYTVGYRAQNLFDTYINAEAIRDLEVDKSYKNYASIDREFYSPYARWAGQLSMRENLYKENIYHQELDTLLREPLKFRDFNAWGAYAIPIANKDSEEKLPTNLVIAGRFTKRFYMDRPGEQIDSVSYFTNSNVLLGSIGVRNINFTRDRYIFRNGDIEDISLGYSYILNAGVQRNSSTQNFLYLGIDLTFSDYLKNFGYLATNIGYGSYFRNGAARQSLFRLENTYFTPIFRIGSWFFRQFIKTNMVVGIKRKDFINDRISINDDDGIYGFDTHEVYGTRKFVFNFQTQSYVPFNWLGFRMSPFVNFDLGFIGEEPTPFFQNELYTKFGLGVLISNDYFVFDNIRLSFAIFPNIPGRGRNVLDFDVNTDNQFRLENYRYEPPHILEFR